MLVLGSAQFGFEYAGSTGNITNSDLIEILNLAYENGISEIDTAVDYGLAEYRLGNAGCKNFLINSKLPANLQNSGKKVKEVIIDSLSRLNVSHLNTIYIHNLENFLNHPNSAQIYNDLLDCKEEGLVSQIGVSIYNTSDLERYWRRYSCDVIQGPFNYFDDRLTTFIANSKIKEMSLHYRSIFLQGTLLDHSLRSNLPFKERFHFFDRTVEGSEYCDSLSFCMAYARQHLGSSSVIVGVKNVKDLMQIIRNYDQAKNSPSIQRNGFIESDYEFVNPYLWSSK